MNGGLVVKCVENGDDLSPGITENGIDAFGFHCLDYELSSCPLHLSSPYEKK
jgi:hypothetical protein